MPPRTTTECKGVYLLSHPRSASNLFEKMMEKQPGYKHLSYKLFDYWSAAMIQFTKSPLSTLPEADRQALYDLFDAGVESLQKEVAEVNRNGKQAFVKEHTLFLTGAGKLLAKVYGDEAVPEKTARTNPSGLPDDFLLAGQPIFQIRHPALMFPSLLRAQGHILEDTNTQNPWGYVYFTLRPSRELYDWYVQNEDKTGRKPRIIDADDIMNNPAAVRQLCLDTGLDPEAVQYEWEEKKEENPQKNSFRTTLHASGDTDKEFDVRQAQNCFLKTIHASKGIIKGLDSSQLDIEVEKVKWKKEFGDQTGDELAEYVYKAMVDYDYLLAQPNRVTGKSNSA